MPALANPRNCRRGRRLNREQLEAIHDTRKKARSHLRLFQPDVYEIASHVAELGLAAHAFELDARGYTVVLPVKVAPGEFIQRLTDTILRLARERSGEAATD